MTDTKKMVLGFVFNQNLSKVLLVNRKNAKQEWQNGKDNGLGGKIEPGETSAEAMVREFGEESEYMKVGNWAQFGSMGGEGWLVDLYCTKADGSVSENLSFETPEGLVRWCSAEQLPETIINNLLVLVPMAKYKLLYPDSEKTKFDYC